MYFYFPQSAAINSLELNVDLQSREAEMIASTGVRTPAELLSVLWNFPTLAKHGVDFAKLSNAAMQSSGGSAMLAMAQQSGFFTAPPPLFSQGAMHPEGASAPIGYSIPFTTGPAAGPAPPSGGGLGAMFPAAAAGVGGVAPPPTAPVAIDFYPPGGWPVRDQGSRGTCVAFATAACHERHAAVSDLSEQFLYWAIKTQVGDPWPTQDGTRFEYARRALLSDGNCEESFWPYNPAVIIGNVSHSGPGDPSLAAKQDAATRLNSTALSQTGGGAAAVISELQARAQPVGISVAVFIDPAQPQNNNWNTLIGRLFGRIIDPPPTSIVGGGHAVCITGFRPDPSEALGGWFIVRNSWGTTWGSSLPAAGYYGPEAGYGQISASYVDRYLWEIFSL